MPSRCSYPYFFRRRANASWASIEVARDEDRCRTANEKMIIAAYHVLVFSVLTQLAMWYDCYSHGAENRANTEEEDPVYTTL